MFSESWGNYSINKV